MEHEDAKNLVSFMKSAFPKSYFPEESMITYADLLTGLTNPQTAYEAIRDLIDSQPDLPSFAAIRETYAIKRQRQIEKHGLPEGTPDDVPPPRQFLALLGQLQTNAKEFEPPNLVEVAAGRCDDCQHDVEHRYHFGSYLLCLTHAMARARVANELEGGRHEIRYYKGEVEREAAAQADGTESAKDALEEADRART